MLSHIADIGYEPNSAIAHGGYLELKSGSSLTPDQFSRVGRPSWSGSLGIDWNGGAGLPGATSVGVAAGAAAALR